MGSLFQNYKKADGLCKTKNQSFIEDVFCQFDTFCNGIVSALTVEMETCRKVLKQVVVDTKPMDTSRVGDSATSSTTLEVFKSVALYEFASGTFKTTEFTEERLMFCYHSYLTAEKSMNVPYGVVKDFVSRTCRHGMKQKYMRMVSRRTAVESNISRVFYKFTTSPELSEEE